MLIINYVCINSLLLYPNNASTMPTEQVEPKHPTMDQPTKKTQETPTVNIEDVVRRAEQNAKRILAKRRLIYYHGTKYLKKLHEQLKLECNAQRGRKEEDWLIQYLQVNGWWILKEHAPNVAKKLSMPEYPQTNYSDVRVWIPDLQYGMDCMPCCPCCKRRESVIVHGFHSNHVGRLVGGITRNYYILSRRYRCTDCKDKAEQFKRQINHAGNAIIEHEKLQYTFMAWNQHTLPLYPKRLSEEFPAFLTHRAALDIQAIDLMTEVSAQTQPSANGQAIGDLPNNPSRRGKRGQDRRQRARRQCKKCQRMGGNNATLCTGRGGEDKCIFF